MGIDDAPLYPPAAHGELLPVEHNLALIPTLITDGDPTVLCRVKRKGCAVRLKKRSSFPWIDGDGPAAMLWDLQRMDLGDWHPRMIPEGLLQGAALRKQQGFTLPPLEQWYLSLLHRGVLPGALPNRPNTTYTKSLMDDAKERGGARLRYDLTEVTLRNFFTDPEKVGAACNKFRSAASNGWAFPPLAEARAAWEKIWGDVAWDNPAEEWKRGARVDLGGGMTIQL
jgi:hypothetical protein